MKQTNVELYQHPTRKWLYVTPDGRIFRELIPSIGYGGYHTVSLKDGTIRRHTLICEAFHGKRPRKLEVRHLDGNPANDAPSNLAWGSHSENMKDRLAHGRGNRGSKHGRAKLTESQVIKIKKGLRGGSQPSKLAKEFQVSIPTICSIRNGENWGWLKVP